MRGVLLVALLLLSSLSGTTDAVAVSQVAPGGPRIVGPKVDGDKVVWGVHELDGLQFRVLDTGGSVSAGGSASGRGQWGIAADAGDLAYFHLETRCSDDRCGGAVFLTAAELGIGPHAGPYAVLDQCPGSTRVPEICDTSTCFGAGVFVELSDRVLAHSEFCRPSTLIVRDLDTGEVRVHDRDLAAAAATAGRYLAVRETEAAEIVVSDALTGEERFRVQDAADAFAISPDGLLALYDFDTGELSWADQQNPSTHHVATLPPGLASMRVRNGLIALARSDPYFGDIARITVFDLAGRSVSQPTTDASGDWDFDGRRIAWASAPCELDLVVVWDPGDVPPALPDGACPVLRDVSAAKRVRSDRVLRMEFACPAQPQLGCLGNARLLGRSGTRRRLLGTPTFAVMPGESEETSLTLSRRAYRWLDRQDRVKVVMHAFAVRRDGHVTQERRRFRFVIRAI